MTSELLNENNKEWLIRTKLKEIFSREPKFNLIYKATRDGFACKDFHEKCDGIENTLTVIQSAEYNYVFGGFTSVCWDSSESEYKYDNNAFIFSLINKNNDPIIMSCCSPEYAIYNCGNGMPIFGAGQDISLKEFSNKYNNSSTRLGYSYKHPSYEDFSDEAKKFLAGSYYFQINDIEIYKLE